MAKGKRLPRGITWRKERGGQYRVRVTYQGVQHEIGQFDRLAHARAALDVARGQIAAGTFVPPLERRAQWKAARQTKAAAAVTVRDWSQTWLDLLAREGKAPGTLAAYGSALNTHVLPRIGRLPLAQVEPSDIEALVDGIPTRPARSATLGVVRSMFARAVESRAGGLAQSPAATVRIPNPPPSLPRDDDALPTPAQVRALAAAMPLHLQPAVLLAGWCGLRAGEVRGLVRADLTLGDPDNARVTIARQMHAKARTYTPPKSDSARRVSIPPSLVPRLQAHLNNYVGPAPSSPVFPSPIDQNRPISETALGAAWRRARADIKPGMKFHALRHFALTVAARQGATVGELLERGGHKSAQVAAGYQHSSAERDRQIAHRLDALIRGGNDE